MRFNTFFLIAIAVFLLAGCDTEDQADVIVQQTIDAHFPSGLENKQISFDFRERSYSSTRYPDRYIYTRSFNDSLGYVKDILVNSSEFIRTVNNDTIQLTDEWRTKYTSSVNAVLYFFQIPYVLNDGAAKKKLLGEGTIRDESYWKIKVTFAKESGGEDHDDEFLYWINQKTSLIDYFAYNYTEDEGGVRFREAINRRTIEGLTFQDYVNYEVEIGTSLDIIPKLFEAGKLKELSRIINEDITVTKIP